MKFSLNKLLTAFGNNRDLEKKPIDDLTKNIIEEIEETPFGISEQNVMYAGINELAGYFYLQTVVVGDFKIKTINGAKLLIEGVDFNLELNSDMEELESDYKASNRTITKIDFEIEKEDIPKINKTSIRLLRLKTKNKLIEFAIKKD